MSNTRRILFDRSPSGSSLWSTNLSLTRFTVLMLILAAVFISIPVTEAIPFRLRRATLNKSITLGRSVDKVLLDGVTITDGVKVVFDISAMVPTALQIELNDCVCNGGSQIEVRGLNGEVKTTDKTLKVVINRLSGDLCSLMFANHMPLNTKVTIRDSTIVARIPERNGDEEGKEPANKYPPLVLEALTLTKGQLRLENSVLRTNLPIIPAIQMNGNVKLVNGALVLDGVLLEVMGKNDGYAMQVSTSSIFSLQEHSVFSLTNSSIISDAKGIFFGNSFTLTDSILRLARVDGRVSSGPLLNFGSGSIISTHGWLDLHNVMSTGDSTASIASLSQVKLAGGVLSIARSAAVGATLLTGPHVQSGKISVQCNRANGKLLQSPEEYRSAGLSAVEVVPCDSCARELSCFAGLTSSMPNCACRCSPGGVGPSCLPMDVPLAKADKKEKECMRGVAVTKSMTIGQGQSNVCFEAVAFSGPIIVTVDLRSMNTLAKTLDVTLQRCMLAGGAQLRIRGFDKDIAKMMPRVSLSVTNMTSTEGTIVLQGVLPEMSSVLLADSMLSSSVNESKYVITSSGNKSIKYSPVLVLDGVKFVSTNFVLTRTTMMCAGSSCAVILVEHGLTLEKKSGFYMDNCGVNAAGNVVNFISSDLNILDRSVFSLRNNSWRVKSEGTGNAWECNEIALKGGSVLEMTGNTMSLQKSVINMDLLKVEGNSWLLQRENEFQCEYVFKAEKVEFAEKNVWSVIRNKFWKPSLSRYGGADMWNQPISNNYQDLTVYGVCNYRFGEPVLDYTRLSMPKTVQKVECNTCSASAECFNGKAASSDNTDASNKGGCKCKCASGGHGDFCLPVAPPKSLGPLPPPEVGATDIPCVYGGNISSITSPVLGTSGMCFIGVHFTSPIVIDLSEFRPKRKTINITFVQCTMSSVSLTGVKDYAVHMNMRASTITDGKLVLGGKFGSESHIQLVDSIIDTTDAEGFVMESKTVLGSNSKILLLRTNIIAGKHAIYFNNDFALDANGFIVQNSRLEATVPQSTASAGLYVNTLQIKNSGYLSIVNTEIIAGSGVLLAYGGAISSSGRLVLVGNTLKGHGKITGTALLYRGSGVKLSGGSIIRVMLNRVKGTSIYQAKPEYSGTLELSGEGTAVIFSENVMEGDVPAFLTVKTSLTSQGKIVGGCNKKNGKVVSLKEQFENSTVTEFNCDACSEDVKCHMPGKNELTKSSSCSCSHNGKSGNNQQCPSCLPYEVPEIDVMNTLKKPVDSGTTCVENQILTELSLNMQKTHHCYIGVTFSGEKAVAKFVFGRMPLQKPINITFTGCTFLGGAALHFVGSRDPVNSAGVWIRVRKTVLLSSVVSFSNALPKGSDIAVREVDSVQTSWVKTPDGISNALSIVAMKDLLLSGSSILLVSDIYARHKGTSKYILNSGDGILAGDSLTLLDESSLYVQNCRFSRFEHMIKLNGQVNIDERSVMAFLENKLLSGKYLMFSKEVMINDRSVFRMVENSNLDGKGVYMYKNWDLHNSSWVDWRGNDVSIGELVHVVSKAGVNIDSNSMLTFIGKRKESKGASAPLLKSKQEGYKFISGCLTLPKDTEGSNSNNVTDQVECDRCVDKGHCFAPFTSSSNDCSCKCTDGGHGDVCVPGRVAVPLLPPPLPSPPAPGECMSNVKYPEVSQTLGNGLSSLCYRNVTFSGAFTRITVDLRAMTGEVVNITFDGCKWLSGAALVLRGGSENEKGTETSARSINIAITGNTFHEGMLSPFGSFPPRTNIIVSGSHFNVTRIIAVPDMMSVQRSCIMTKGLKLNDHSSLKLIDNSFIVSNKESTVMFVGTSGMTVKSHSMFAMVGNKFTFTDDGSAVLRVMGDEVKKGLEVQDNSVFAIEKSLVSGILEDFVFLSVLHAKEKSAFLVENNDGLMVTNILKIKEDMNLNDSWLRMHKNAAYNLSATVFRVDSTVEMAGSKVVLSGNSVSPVMSKTTPAIVALKSYRNHKFERDSSLIFACNVLNRKVVTEYNDKPTNASVNIVGCDGSCSLEGSCFPALSASISASNCACECTNGGHGDRCLPVHVPKLPDEDPCVRNINVSWEVHAGFRKSSVCYVGVTFTQDVVLDLTTMSGTVRNVTLKNCKMVGNASLYIVGWESELPAGQRVEVLISGLESRSGGGVLLAKNYPQGSHITVVDSVLVAETPVNYSGSYDLLKASACLVLYKLGLTGSVLTIARTQVITTLNDVRGVLVTGGVTLSSGSALYMQQLWVQAALGECVSVVGSVTARSNSVLAFVDSDFLSCSHAVSMQDPLTVAGSVVKFVRNDFVLPSDHAVKFHSPLSFTEGSMLLMKANTHDNSEKEMVMVAGTVTAGESILSFVRNQVLSPRMLSAKIETNAGAHLKVSCNTVGGNKLTKATEYAAAGFGNAAQINVFGCETCDKDTYCYPSGAVSSAEENGDCVCKCRRDSYGEVCLPVESITLPPVSKPLKSSAFALENTTVQSPLVVTRDVKEVTLRNLVMEGVQTVLYVPWMAKDNIRIFLQNISLRNGAVLYLVGGSGIRRPLKMDENQRLEFSACAVETFNGAIALAGTFPANSILTITNSLLITTEIIPFVYLPSRKVEKHTPVLLLWNLHLIRSKLVFREVALLPVMTGGQAVVAGGSLLQLTTNSGMAFDAVELGGECALHAHAKVSLSAGALLRLSESKVYGGRGLVFEHGMSTDASAVVIGDNTGVLKSGALLILQGKVLFVSGSWLSVRGNKFAGKLLSLSPQAKGAQFMHSTLTLHENTVIGSVMMDGAIASQSSGEKFVVGCLKQNGRTLTTSADHASVGITGNTRIVGCNTCDADVKCFAAETNSISSCGCKCNENGYGHSCLPVSVPRPVGCNSTSMCPALKITTLLGRELSQDDIRNVGSTSSSSSSSLSPTTTTATASSAEGVAKLMVTLPPPFRWANDADKNLGVKFELGSPEQKNGYQGPWGALLRNATWRRNASSPENVLELEVPGHAEYFVGLDEMIHLQYGPNALHGGCLGNVRGSFVITSNTPEELREALFFFTGISVSASTVAVGAAGGLASLVEAQTLGALTMMSCASAHERTSLTILPYFLSPFAGLGFLWMVIGNMLIILVFASIHYGLTSMLGNVRGHDTETAWSTMRFPSITYLVAYLLHPGIVVGSAFTLAMPEAQIQHYVVGVIGALYSVGFLVGTVYFVGRRSKAEFLPYDDFTKMSLSQRWLYPVGYWCPSSKQRMYGSMFMSVRGGYGYMCVFQLTVLCIVGVMAAIRPPANKCHILYIAMALVLFMGATVMAFTNMMRSLFLTIMYTLGFVLLSLLCITNAVNALTPSDVGLRVYAGLVLMLTLLLLTVAVYCAVLCGVESRRWRPLRTRPDKHPESIERPGTRATAPSDDGDEEGGLIAPTPTEPTV